MKGGRGGRWGGWGGKEGGEEQEKLKTYMGFQDGWDFNGCNLESTKRRS